MANATVTINKKTYDRALLNAVKKAVAGRGDGRISKTDAEELLKVIKADGKYDDIEKETIKFARGLYKWTQPADEYFRDEIRKWASNR